MTGRDISWIQAATTALMDSPTVWMSASELVREIERKDIKNIRTNYGQSVRTLRTALTLNCRKDSSPFLRCDGDTGIMFGLRRRSGSYSDLPVSFQTSKDASTSRNQKTHKRLTQQHQQLEHQHEQPLLMTMNDLCQGSLQPPLTSPTFFDSTSPALSSTLLMNSIHSISARVPETLTVEIDPHAKGTRTPATLGSGGATGVCLPSPVFSILGPMRTLHVLSESSELADQRPVRQVRRRRAKRSVSDSPLSPLVNGYCNEGSHMSSCGSTPEVLQLVTCHSLPSHRFDVTCVRPPSTHPPSSGPQINSTYDDPCTAQGDRSFSASFLIEPKPFNTITETDSDPSMGHVTEHSTSGSDSESELSDIQLQPRPTSQLLVRRLSQQRQHLASMDFSQMSDSDLNEDDDDNDECAMDDVDVEYVDPKSSACQRTPEVMKRRRICRRPSVDRLGKVGGDGAQLEAAGVEASRRVVDDTQKKNISVLFQPQSSLIGENMKAFLNMEAFTNLSEVEKTRLVKLLPEVDRTGPSSIVKCTLNNSFFSSALREWVEQVALGGFTPEHRAKLRADEKRKNTIGKHEEMTWKSKFFEENWGDKMVDDVENTPSSTLFFPHSKSSSGFSQACLKTIFRSFQGEEDLESPPQTPPPKLSPPSTPIPLPTLPSSTASSSQTAPPLTNVLSLSPSSLSTKKHPPSPLPPSPSLTLSCSALSSPLSSTSPAKPVIGQSPPLPQPLPSPKPSTPPQAKQKTPSPKATTVLTKKGVKLTTKNALVQRKNHVAKRVLNKVAVVPIQVKSDESSQKMLPAKLLSAASSARSGSILSKLSTSKIIEQWRQSNQHSMADRGVARNKDVATSHFLSRLPPRTPYQTLLIALAKASKLNKGTVHVRGGSHYPHAHVLASHSYPLQAKSDPPSTTSHTYSVFHDHFSLLSKSHVPLEFCAPVVTFPVKWPIQVYRTCLSGRQVQKEHSYSNRITEKGEKKGNKTDKEMMNLKLSVPRSILRTNDCLCDKVSLVFCSCCNSLYHSKCGGSTRCPTCSAP